MVVLEEPSVAAHQPLEEPALAPALTKAELAELAADVVNPSGPHKPDVEAMPIENLPLQIEQPSVSSLAGDLAATMVKEFVSTHSEVIDAIASQSDDLTV